MQQQIEEMFYPGYSQKGLARNATSDWEQVEDEQSSEKEKLKSF
jgi:hypothetical protein